MFSEGTHSTAFPNATEQNTIVQHDGGGSFHTAKPPTSRKIRKHSTKQSKKGHLIFVINMRAEMRKHRAAPQSSRSTGFGVTNKSQ